MERLPRCCQVKEICFGTCLCLAITIIGCTEVPPDASDSLENLEKTAENFGNTAQESLGGLLGETRVTNRYEATATTTYTWLVEYSPAGSTQDRPRDRRIETFSSSYRVNVNGQPVVQDFGNSDSQGLWWPALPTRPTVDELEARQKRREVYGEPQINKSVEYTLTFEQSGEMITVATNHSVYREAVRGLQAERPLQITFGREEAYIRQAKIHEAP